MNSLRLLFAALLAATTLTSCGSFARCDSRNPTVAQQDAYDVSWGLSPRKVRGTPKHIYQYKAKDEYAAPVSPAPLSPAPASSPAPVAPASGPARISPTIPSNLR